MTAHTRVLGPGNSWSKVDTINLAFVGAASEAVQRQIRTAVEEADKLSFTVWPCHLGQMAFKPAL